MIGLERITEIAKFRGTKLFVKGIIYVVLLSLGFVFLYPLLYMLATSFMGKEDLVSPYVVWIPRQFNLQNYLLAAIGLQFLPALKSSIVISLCSAAGQTFSCALVGYGLGRYKFPGRGVIFVLVLLSFIIPPQVILIPLFIQFSRLRMIFTYLPFIVPSALGHGLRGALFVIIYRQFIASLPRELDDSARLDGVGGLQLFLRIVLPISKSALLVVFLFSFVWNWNESYLSGIFLHSHQYPLSVRLSLLWSDVRQAMAIREDASLSADQIGAIRNAYFMAVQYRSEGLGMAASVMTISVPLLVYFALQRFFTESIERTGLVG